MAYFLWRALLAQFPTVEISAERYSGLLTAWKHLGALVSVEEGWDCLVENYVELEREILSVTVRETVINEMSYGEFQNRRLLFSRRLSNLMQSCCGYVDHASRDLAGIARPLKDEFSVMTENMREEVFFYRLGDQLRNFAQHCGLPVHSLSFSREWMGNDEIKKNKLMYSSSVYVSPSRLLESDKRMDRKIKDELQKMSENLDLLVVTRGYVEALSQIHCELRSMTEKFYTQAKLEIDNAISEYRAVAGDDIIGLRAAEFDGEGNVKRSTPLFSDLPERIEYLRQKNGSLVNLSARFVSNEPRPSKNR